MKRSFYSILVSTFLCLGYVLGQTQKITLITTLVNGEKYSGDFGGFDGGDRICRGRNGGDSGGYVALLKGNPSLISVNGGNTDKVFDFYDIHGNLLFSSNFGSLFSGRTHASGDILDRNGRKTYDFIAWTGANGDQCKDDRGNPWSFGELTKVGGQGEPTVGDKWINSGGQYCNIKHLLYCVVLQPNVRGDPHFVGFNGCKFDFDGISDEIFAIYSDSRVQVNAMFQHLQVGAVSGNWMTQLGIRVGDISVVLNPSDGVLVSELQMVYTTPTKLQFNDSSIEIECDKNGMVSSLSVESESMHIKAEVKHFLDTKETFINLDFVLRSRPNRPHGVLGQSAREVSSNEPGVYSTPSCETPMEGITEDYIVHDGILGTHFTFSEYDVELPMQRRSFPSSIVIEGHVEF